MVQQSELQGEILANNATQAQLNRLPSINASGNHNYNIGRTIDPFTNSFNNTTIQSNSFSISGGVLLYGGNQVNNSIRRNAIDQQANDAGIEMARNQIALQVATNYLQILQSEENLKLAEAQVELSQAQVDRIQKMVERGALNQGNLLNIKAQLANDKISEITAQNQIQLAYNSLINMLQIPLDSAFEIEPFKITELPPMPMESVASLYETSLSSLPEIRQASLQVRSAELNERIASSSLLPSLTAYGNVNTVYSQNAKIYTITGYTEVPIGITQNTQEVVVGADPQFETETKPFKTQLTDNLGQSVGFSLSIPLFNNYRNRTGVQNAKINTQISKLNALNTNNQLRSEITTAYTNLKAANSRYNAALLNVEAQRLNFEYLQKRFDSGLVNLIDLNTAKTLYFQAQIQLINAKYEYVFRNLIIEYYKGNELKL